MSTTDGSEYNIVRAVPYYDFFIDIFNSSFTSAPAADHLDILSPIFSGHELLSVKILFFFIVYSK